MKSLYHNLNQKEIFLGIIFLLLSFLISYTAAFFWTFFLIIIYFKLSYRISAAFALFCLALCPFLLIFDQLKLAETFAIYTYYFLVIAVFFAIIDHFKHPEKTAEENEISHKETVDFNLQSFFTQVKDNKEEIKKLTILIIAVILISAAINSGYAYLTAARKPETTTTTENIAESLSGSGAN